MATKKPTKKSATPAKKTSKAAAKKTTKKVSSKRELIAPHGDKRLIRRDAKGRITESDDLGKSLSQDVRKAAKKIVPAGQGDKGDQRKTKKRK